MPDSDFDVSPGEIHVWHLPLGLDADARAPLAATLEPEEHERVARFRFDVHRHRFIAGRGWLRTLLGRYLGHDPQNVRFVYGDHGKPFLLDYDAPGSLRFNLTHSQDVALLALTRGRAVGIDVEWMRPLDDAERLVTRFFSDAEQRAFLRLPPEARHAAFFTGWTRKEAYIKARGEGLSFPLHAFDVPIVPEEPAALLRTQGDAREAERWSLADVPVPDGFKAALAVEGPTGPILHREAVL